MKKNNKIKATKAQTPLVNGVIIPKQTASPDFFTKMVVAQAVQQTQGGILNRSILENITNNQNVLPFQGSNQNAFNFGFFNTNKSSMHVPGQSFSSGGSMAVHQQIMASMFYYFTNGTVRNVIDLMTDIASEGLTFYSKNKTVENFFTIWANRINLNEIVEQILLEYYRSGNVGIVRLNSKLEKDQVDQIVKTLGNKTNAQKVEIPFKYYVVNPLNIQPRNTLFGNSNSYSMLLPVDMTDLIKNPKTEEEKLFVSNLDSTVKKTAIDKGILNLDSDMFYTIFRKKQPYEPLASPFIFSILDDLEYKQALRLMDRSAADSIINALYVVKVGEKDSVASQATLEAVGNLLKNGGASNILVWRHDIEIDLITAPVGEILGAEKYTQVDQDILRGLGISSSMAGGKGESFSNSFLNIRVLLERLEDGRNKIITWLETETRKIVKELGFKSFPKIRFSQMSLRDEVEEKRIITRLSEIGVITPKTVFDMFQNNELPDFEEEIERMQELKELKKKGLFLSPTDKKANSKPNNTNIDENGVHRNREPGVTAPQEEKRKTKPKGMGDYKIIAEKLFDKVKNITEEEIRTFKNKKQGSKLTKEDKEILAKTVPLTYTWIDENSTEETIKQLVQYSLAGKILLIEPKFQAVLNKVNEKLKDKKEITDLDKYFYTWILKNYKMDETK